MSRKQKKSKTLDEYITGSIDIDELVDPVTGKHIDQRNKRFSVDD